MKESYQKGLATHLSRERKHHIPEAEPVGWREGNTGSNVMRVVACSGGVKEPGMCGHSLHGNRETSGRSLNGN